MTYYSPTPPLPSRPYGDMDEIVTALCDYCLAIHDNKFASESERQQYFDVTISIIDFWDRELQEVENNVDY